MIITKACPECGCEEFVNENIVSEGFRMCKKCHQEYWTHINYNKNK